MFSGYRLARHWASLRFDDTSGIDPSKIENRSQGIYAIFLGFFLIFLGYSWDAFGMFLGCFWDMLGIFLGFFLDFF